MFSCKNQFSTRLELKYLGAGSLGHVINVFDFMRSNHYCPSTRGVRYSACSGAAGEMSSWGPASSPELG